jgi:uncharacterized protein YndB with AHSA1/START domain
MKRGAVFIICALMTWGTGTSSLAQAGEPFSLEKQTELLEQSIKLNWDASVSHTVVIHAPLAEVWDYVSDSATAQEWSVYFDHISALPGFVTDGEPGSIRRCFRNADELGARWDEIIFDVQPLEMRQIWTFNMRGFVPRKLALKSHSFVRQIYRSLSPNITELTFQSQADPRTSISSRMIFDSGKRQLSRIFIHNLENIKAAIEQKEKYHRPHPWEKRKPLSLEWLFTTRR